MMACPFQGFDSPYPLQNKATPIGVVLFWRGYRTRTPLTKEHKIVAHKTVIRLHINLRNKNYDGVRLPPLRFPLPAQNKNGSDKELFLF